MINLVGKYMFANKAIKNGNSLEDYKIILEGGN